MSMNQLLDTLRRNIEGEVLFEIKIMRAEMSISVEMLAGNSGHSPRKESKNLKGGNRRKLEVPLLSPGCW